MILLKLIGILNIIFLIVVTGYLMSKAHSFSFRRNTLSQLVKYTKSKILFETTLFIFSVNQVLLCTFVYIHLRNIVSIYPLLLFVFGGICLCIASIYNVIKHPTIHLETALISGAAVWLGGIIASIDLLKVNNVLAIIMFIAVIPIPIIYFLRKKFEGGYWEVAIMTLIFLCNLILTAFLFN